MYDSVGRECVLVSVKGESLLGIPRTKHCLYQQKNPPTLLASSGWEQSEQPNTLPPYFPPPSTVLLYYRTAALPYYRKDRTTVKTVRSLTDDRMCIVFRARSGESCCLHSVGQLFSRTDMGLPMSVEPFLRFFFTLTWDSPCQWINFRTH